MKYRTRPRIVEAFQMPYADSNWHDTKWPEWITNVTLLGSVGFSFDQTMAGYGMWIIRWDEPDSDVRFEQMSDAEFKREFEGCE